MNAHVPGPRAAPSVTIEAEQALLGAILINAECLDGLRGWLDPKHFAEPLHEIIYRAALDLSGDGKRVTIVTVGIALSGVEMPEGAPSIYGYLARLGAGATTVVNAPDYGAAIVESWRKRTLAGIAAATQAAVMFGGTETAARIASGMIEAVAEIVEAEATSTRRAIGESAADLLSYTARIRNGEEKALCVTTGFAELDRALGGYEAGSLTIVAARPGVGKTAMMVTSSSKVARAGARAQRDGEEGFAAMAFSLEVPERQITARYLSDLTYHKDKRIEYGRIPRGDFNDTEAWILEDATKRLMGLPLTIDCPSGLSVTEIAGRIRAEKKRMAKRGFRLGVIFIDYLRFVKGSGNWKGQRHYEFGEISNNLKRMAKDENLAVVLLAQLNRALDKAEDKRPALSDLKDSGDLEADADNVLFLHREAYHILKSAPYRGGDDEARAAYAACEHGAEIIIGKNRSGPETTIHLWCDIGCSTMMNASRYGS